MTVATALRRTGASGFDPLTSIAWEAAFWASDPSWSNPGDGNGVSSWRNAGSRAGAGNAVQAASNLQPIYRASVAALNGQPGIDFDGAGATGDRLLTANFSSSFSTAATFVVIGKRDGAGGGNNECIMKTADASTYTQIYMSPSLRFNPYASGFFAGPAHDTNAHLLRGYFAGASSAIAVDERVTTGTLSTSLCAFVGFGYGTSSSDAANMTIAFAGLYAGNITTDGQWSAFKTWAASTYGLTIA